MSAGTGGLLVGAGIAAVLVPWLMWTQRDIPLMARLQ